MVPTVLFSVAFNLPKFFEFVVVWTEQTDPETFVNTSVAHTKPTDLR